jgi:hypothetical protein
MGMKQTLDVINRMEADGIIGRYAIAGAVAAYNYIEPSLTDYLDILVSFDEPATAGTPALTSLDPIYSYLKNKGYDEHRKEGIVVEDWPVQFVPVARQLDAEALAQAVHVDVEINKAEGSAKTRILRPEHFVANALRVGRPQDLIRITQILQENAVDLTVVRALLDRHHLTEAWESFCKLTGSGDSDGSDKTPMSNSPKDGYPDISDILARKAEGRREIARRTLAKKLP